MGVHLRPGQFDRSRSARVADDMLARVLREHAERRIVAIAAANQKIVGSVVVPVRVEAFGRAVTTIATSPNLGSLIIAPKTATGVALSPALRNGVIAVQFLYAATQLARLILKRRRGARNEDVLAFIARRLREQSPVLSGAYRDSLMLLADGRFVANARDVAAGADIPDAKEYAFVSPEPYSRKIEVGKTKSGRDFVISVPSRLHQRVAAEAKARFPDLDISFSFESLNGGRLGNWAGSSSARRLAGRIRRGNAAFHREWLTRQPTIFIRMK
jgi:hypothetical protein